MTLLSHPCDVLVVGGGIHGVGVAQAAAAAGYETVLVESRSLAAGTSSKSSKLIHGGLRYLEHGHIKLVRESLHERELLIRLAPGLVNRQAFYLPVYKGMSRPAWQLRAGLSLYALLAGLRKHVGFRSVPKREWSSLDGLQTNGLQHVFQYWDAQTDDAALTRAVMRSAQELGATLLCPASLQSCVLASNGSAKHCLAEIETNGEVQRWQAKVVVNAAGPWANEVLRRCEPSLPQMPVDHVQGTHLELPTEVQRGCYYMEVASDQRAVFVIPWKGRTMLGTTEHVYDGDPALVKPLEVEQRYLLDVYRQHFPGKPCDVLDAWSGLRVLPRAQGNAFGRSRETQLPVDNETQPRFVSIFGGKLTGYRATAEKVIERIAGSLPRRSRIATTNELRLADASTSDESR